MQGSLRKMIRAPGPDPQYLLPVGTDHVALNQFLGQPLSLTYTRAIQCVACGRTTSKSYNQGYCYPCFTRLAACDLCIVKPERCHFAAGTCREPTWAQDHCLQPHYVYLANTSGMKVGITRASQIPTRWFDQGAVAALKLMRVASRHLAGQVEVILARHVKDKTDWRRMLSGPPPPMDLAGAAARLLAQCQDELSTLQSRHDSDALQLLTDESMMTIEYPVIVYPDKVRALNLEKEAQVTGTLQGIKGQYLLLDRGVLNIRKYSGYIVAVNV